MRPSVSDYHAALSVPIPKPLSAGGCAPGAGIFLAAGGLTLAPYLPEFYPRDALISTDDANNDVNSPSIYSPLWRCLVFHKDPPSY
ncbi:hypothetical protein GJ744_011225 [Endocarpon pusillum]|uniref:Uncharacterized protein n=1 Tax=Endocarpon pusillum TaxID=364733 RepID=A0A8H7ASX2_9EURO|nr:hypothetical protein GJ744_011225 [Endocarpon pusillum]